MNDNDEYREIVTSFRHYSNLRFAILTLFSGASAGLLASAFGDVLKNASPDLRYVLRIVGFVLSIGFLAAEFSIASYIHLLFELGRNYPNGFLNKLASAAWFQRLVLRYVYRLLYAGVAALWCWTLFLPK